MAARWWRSMEPRNRRWLILNAVVGTAVVNFVVNGALGWLNVLGVRHVAVWSIPLAQRGSIFTDAIGTFFFLPLTTCILCTLAVRSEQRRRGLPSVAIPFGSLVTRVPSHPLRRGLVLGALSLLVLTPANALVLAVSGIQGMNPSAFVLYAALLGVGLGLVVTPVVALLAMAESSTTFSPNG